MSLARDLLSHGYTLTKWAADNLGRQWEYKVSPSISGGVVNYFDSIYDLDRWIKDVALVRRWTNEID